MLLKQVPTFKHAFHLNRISILLCIFLIFLLFLGFLPWRPKYPVKGLLKVSPDIVMVRSNQEGIVKDANLFIGKNIRQGDVLFKISPVNQLISSTANRSKLKNLELILNKLKLEITYQKTRLKKLRPLLQRKVITEDLFHQILSELRNKEIEYHKVLEEVKNLQNQQEILIQAPISGKIINLEIYNTKMIKKNKVLFAIQPKAKKWEVFFKLPLEYKPYLLPDSMFKLSLPSNLKFKRYLLYAKLNSLSRVVIHQSKSDFLYAHARIIYHQSLEKEFIPNLPLTGFLLGPKYTFFNWLMRYVSIQ